MGPSPCAWAPLSRSRLDERDAYRRDDFALWGEAGGAKQAFILAKGPLPSTEEREHVDVEDLRPVRSGVVRNDLLGQEENGVRGRGAPDGSQDRLRLPVGPIVDDLHDDVGVALRKGVLEEV